MQKKSFQKQQQGPGRDHASVRELQLGILVHHLYYNMCINWNLDSFPTYQVPNHGSSAQQTFFQAGFEDEALELITLEYRINNFFKNTN